QNEPVEEPELLLEEPGPGVAVRFEGERANAEAVLPTSLDAERARGPRSRVEVVDPLDLAPLDLEAPRRLTREAEQGAEGALVGHVGEVDELDGVRVAPQSQVALPPRDGAGATRQRHDQRPARLAVVARDEPAGRQGPGVRPDEPDGNPSAPTA